MRLAFAGTPEFAVPSLQALVAAGYPLVTVYTRPDTPAGRGRRLRAAPVKEAAQAAGLAVAEPRWLGEEEARRLRDLDVDALVVVAYGQILPRAVLEAPRLGCINLHASLLPRWRGAAPIQRALLAGDRETGVTVMQMGEGLDTGPILAQARCPIAEDDTAATLHDRLAELGAGLLTETLPAVADGRLVPQPQDESRATYAAKVTKEEARLDFTLPAATLARRVRAFDPVPVAWTQLDGERWRVWEAEALPGPAGGVPGEVVAAGADGVEVASGEGRLRLARVQPPGGRVMSAAAALRGHPLEPGRRLG